MRISLAILRHLRNLTELNCRWFVEEDLLDDPFDLRESKLITLALPVTDHVIDLLLSARPSTLRHLELSIGSWRSWPERLIDAQTWSRFDELTREGIEVRVSVHADQPDLAPTARLCTFLQACPFVSSFRCGPRYAREAKEADAAAIVRALAARKGFVALRDACISAPVDDTLQQICASVTDLQITDWTCVLAPVSQAPLQASTVRDLANWLVKLAPRDCSSASQHWAVFGPRRPRFDFGWLLEFLRAHPHLREASPCAAALHAKDVESFRRQLEELRAFLCDSCRQLRKLSFILDASDAQVLPAADASGTGSFKASLMTSWIRELSSHRPSLHVNVLWSTPDSVGFR